uniref:Uncharacterized protein n=1 Tax=Caenorhabditis angaria TaxID=860376 RepID=B6VBW1_9PELO|nr:hypothetical protein Csp3_JD04.003 [Caenorhabditis angaria]
MSEEDLIESLPYSSVRQLRAEYLAKVASTSTPPQQPPRFRRGTVFGTRPTISLPYIPEVDEERRASYHVESTSSYTATSSIQPPTHPATTIPPPPSEPPIPQTQPPLPPPPLNVQIKRVAANPQQPEDYPERLMSPPPTHQPRSILKGQQQQQQYYSSSQHTTSITEQLNPQQMHPRPSDRRTPTHFEDLSEDEKTRIMQENLQRHRNMRSGPNGPRPAVSNFNGPFFRLEQVSPGQQPPRSQSVDPTVQFERHQHYQHHHHQEENLTRMREISASEIELNQHNFQDPSVVVWPPISEKERKRPNSVLAKNIQDPERIAEYQRQKRLEAEAMERREQQQIISMTKQIRAMEIQQQRIYEQTQGVVSPIPIIDTHQYPLSPPQIYEPIPPPPPPPIHPPIHQHQSFDPPAPPPQNVQIFETRPISAMSDELAPIPHSNGPSWKRTYVIEKPKDLQKNEILTSEELLEKDQYDVDLLKRRETFVEKPDSPPQIQRIGRRWQPPPEKPYVWPTNMRRAMSVEPRDFISPEDDRDEYKWAPIVVDPGYKREEKNFTPVNSPPASPRRGHGTGPLDEPAKRQTRHVIQPSSDGSHRPKTVFKKERQTPSGGFYPHAPNAIKIVKKRAQSVQGLLSPSDQQPHVEIIQQRNYHRLDYENGNHQQHKLRRTNHGGSEQDLRAVQDLPDWEKIYELPPHSSQIVHKEMPRNVDVQRRLSKFEGSIQNLRAASSQQQLDVNYPTPDYEHQQRQQRRRTDSSASYRQQQPLPPPPPPLPPQQMSRRNSVASTRIESPIQPHHQHHNHHHHRQSRSDSRGMSRAASSIPLSPQPTLTPFQPHNHNQRPRTPGASRARNYINRATAPSPTPYSYDRARAYVPPALPPGYRLADPLPDMRATSPSPGHTRKMIRNVSESAQRLHPSSPSSSHPHSHHNPHHQTPQSSRAPSRHSPNPTNRFL